MYLKYNAVGVRVVVQFKKVSRDCDQERIIVQRNSLLFIGLVGVVSRQVLNPPVCKSAN
jgi:hypothetical protein